MPKHRLTHHIVIPLKLKVVAAVAGIIFGLLVLCFSLLTMSYQVLGQHYGARTFYLDGPILPDHVLYPSLMLVDRVKLYRASPLRRFDLQLDYASRRLWTSEQLIYKGQNDMAAMTVVKGQKYLISAMLAIRDLDSSQQPEAKERLQTALIQQIQEVQNIELSLSGINTHPLSDLRAQQQVLLNQLQSELKNTRDNASLK